jgi:hypothetical protein
MWCKDPFLGFLEGSGFSVVRLPRRDFRPLQLLSSQKKELYKLGELQTVMIPGNGIALPTLKIDEPAASISGQRTGDLSVGVGLSLLTNVIGAMGGGTIGLDAQYQQAKTVSFQFTDVYTDSVEIAELDQFLGGSDVNPASRHVASLLDADDVYVLTATLKSSRLTVDAKGASGASVGLSVPAIKDVVGTNLTVSGTGTTSSAVTYEGRDRLVFGFQAVRLFYDDGHYTAFEPVQPGTTAARGIAAKPLPPGVKPLAPGRSFAQISDL